MAAEMMTVEVDGKKIKVNKKRLGSWDALKLVDRAEHSGGTTSVIALVEFLQYISGMSEDEVLDMFGGHEAPVSEVVAFAMAVIKKSYQKN